jgi:DNA invertase Pin-like site-specific DNA recombinase
MGRTMSHLIKLIEDFRQEGINFKSICDGAIDTTTATAAGMKPISLARA